MLALTGYHAWEQVCRDRGIPPGMQTIIRRIGVDERRHMAWGTYTCRRHVAADPALWQVVEQTMAEMLPLALSAIEFLSLYDRPLGLDVQDFVAYAAERAQRRSGRSPQLRRAAAQQSRPTCRPSRWRTSSPGTPTRLKPRIRSQSRLQLVASLADALHQVGALTTFRV